MPFLDYNSEIHVYETGTLPHWHQDGKIQFVTFRLADSLPQEKIKELQNIKDTFYRTHTLPWDDKTKLEYFRLIGPMENKLLDNGYGACVLKNKAVRIIVSDTIAYYENIRYQSLAYVIMPNHVHWLLKLFDSNNLTKIIQSVKRQSAKEINAFYNQSGTVWMKEYFDRIIRSHEHLIHCLNYIKDNPKFLNSDKYSLYIAEGLECL